MFETETSEMLFVLVGLEQISDVFVKWISGIGCRVNNAIILENLCRLCFISESALFRSFQIRWRRNRRFRCWPDWRRSEVARGVWVGGDCGIVLKQLSDMLGEPNKIRWNWRFV